MGLEKVHDHGTEEGAGVGCRESVVGGRLVGDCLLREAEREHLHFHEHGREGRHAHWHRHREARPLPPLRDRGWDEWNAPQPHQVGPSPHEHSTVTA